MPEEQFLTAHLQAFPTWAGLRLWWLLQG
jgi:hypothetical protein